MENFKEMVLGGVRLTLAAEKVTLETIAKHIKIEFTNETKDYAFIANLINDDSEEYLTIYVSTLFASLNLFWTDGGLNHVWEKIENSLDDAESLVLKEDETEEEILEELKTQENVKDILR